MNRDSAGRLRLATRGFMALQRHRGPNGFRLPVAQESDQTRHTDHRSDDVDQFRANVVGDQELHDGKACPSHQNGGPDIPHGTTSGKRPDQPERNKQGEERQLATHHHGDFHGVVAMHLGQGDDGRTQGTEGHRGGIGNQRQARGGQG